MIDGPAEVTLKSPPSLDVPIEVCAIGDGAVEAIHEGRIIAIAKPVMVDIKSQKSRPGLAIQLWRS